MMKPTAFPYPSMCRSHGNWGAFHPLKDNVFGNMMEGHSEMGDAQKREIEE